TAIEAVQFGAMRYLIKPVPLDELAHTVGEAARLHQLARLKRQIVACVGGSPTLAGDRAGREALFARAIESMWMAYQPIVAWPAGDIYAYEALLRSREPALNQPGNLIDTAIHLGKLPVLGQAVRACVAGALAERGGTRVFVNLHPQDLLDDTLYAADAPLAPFADHVVFEITERAALDEVDHVSSRIRTLKARGYGIALDDLGAGYSGLSTFAALEPDIIKFDMSLVRDIDTKPVPRRLIGALTS